MKKTFISKLRIIRILCFGIIIIPFLCNILISELISKICASAMLGEVNKVLEESIKLFISFLALLIIPGLLETFMNNYKSVILQKLKFLIYDRVIQNTKYVFSNFGKGELRECLTDDFMQVVNRYSFLFPRLVGIAVVCMGYLIYMYVNSPIGAFTVGAI